eukprot:4522717-Pleurochrysis_carterae.AAC.1
MARAAAAHAWPASATAPPGAVSAVVAASERPSSCAAAATSAASTAPASDASPAAAASISAVSSGDAYGAGASTSPRERSCATRRRATCARAPRPASHSTPSMG